MLISTHKESQAQQRSPRVARRRKRMRNALELAGARQFSNKGIAAVTVEDLIIEADISRATFYEFYSSKYNLLESILNPIFKIAIDSISSCADLPSEDALSGLFETYLLLWRKHREGLLLIPTVDPGSISNFREQHDALSVAILRLLTLAENSDLLRNGSAQYSLKIIARTAIPLLRVYDGHPAADELFRDAMRALLIKSY